MMCLTFLQQVSLGRFPWQMQRYRVEAELHQSFYKTAHGSHLLTSHWPMHVTQPNSESKAGKLTASSVKGTAKSHGKGAGTKKRGKELRS